MDGPNISTAIMLAAIGVLAAPERRLTKPMADSTEESMPSICPRADPVVLPMKNIGVTIPPLPPKFSVIEVKIGYRFSHITLTYCIHSP